MKLKTSSFLLEQALPIGIMLVVFALLATNLFYIIKLLNLLPTSQPIGLQPHLKDIFAGSAVYFKTAVDFALFMGLLMAQNLGWKNRVALEIGTAAGNAFGTILILILWVIFKELHILLAIMILLAALVLFQLGAEGMEHFIEWESTPGIKRTLYFILSRFLNGVLIVIKPITSRILPNFSRKLSAKGGLSWKRLLLFSFSVPFILGLDDFAGYVPLFSVVNVFGFALGTLGAHTLLNFALFLNPRATINFVKNPWVAFFGTLAFVGLAVLGIVEAVKIFA